MLTIPQICLIVLTAVIDAKNIHGVACHLKRDRHAPSVSYSSQTWPYIVVARSSMRALKTTMSTLNEQPQSILFGNPDIPPGPGEPGFSAPAK